MEIKEKFTCWFDLVSGREITSAENTEIAMALEALMNKYQIFTLEAALNPFNKEIYMNIKNN